MKTLRDIINEHAVNEADAKRRMTEDELKRLEKSLPELEKWFAQRIGVEVTLHTNVNETGNVGVVCDQNLADDENTILGTIYSNCRVECWFYPDTYDENQFFGTAYIITVPNQHYSFAKPGKEEHIPLLKAGREYIHFNTKNGKFELPKIR